MLLDNTGNLLERIVVSRVVRHIEQVGPNFTNRQYGLNSGAVGHRQRLKHPAAWSHTGGASILRSGSLPAVAVERLSPRPGIVYAYTRDTVVRRRTVCGVPQRSSVLGPLL